MLSNIYRQHTERSSFLKQKQGESFLNNIVFLHDEFVEKRKKELLFSVDQLTRLVLDRLNDEFVQSFLLTNSTKSLSCRVSECYKNEKRIDQACKQLTGQSNLLLKQSQGWIQLIGQFTAALKV